MGEYKVRYKNAKFSNQKIELDGKSFIHCEFQDCMIILERGDTEISGCTFKNCKLMLKGNAYTVGKIIKLFTPLESPAARSGDDGYFFFSEKGFNAPSGPYH
jgi:hypothetical protein